MRPLMFSWLLQSLNLRTTLATIYLLFVSAAFAQDHKELSSNDLLNNPGYKTSDYIRSENATVMCETYVDPITGDFKPYVTKIDASGNPAWGYYYDLPLDDYDRGTRVTSIKTLNVNSGFIVAGVTQRWHFNNAAYNRIFLMKLSTTGVPVWIYLYDLSFGASWDNAIVNELPSGSLVVAASASGVQTIAMLRTNAGGTSPMYKQYTLPYNRPSIEDIYPIDNDEVIAVGASGHAFDYNGALWIRFRSDLSIDRGFRYVTPNSFGNQPDILSSAPYRSNMIFKGISDGYYTDQRYLRVAGYMHDADRFGDDMTFSKGLTGVIDLYGNMLGVGLYTFNSTFSALHDIDAFDRVDGIFPPLYSTDFVISGAKDLNSPNVKNLISTPTQYTEFNSGIANGIYNVFGRSTMELVSLSPPIYQRYVHMTGTGCGQVSLASPNKVYWANPSLFLSGECLPFTNTSTELENVSREEIASTLVADVVSSTDIWGPQNGPTIPLTSLCDDPCNSVNFEITQSGMDIITAVSVFSGDAISFTYTIDYGDGNTSGTLSPVITPGAHTTTHTYTIPGTYTVCITVMLDMGNRIVLCTKCKTVYIGELMIKQIEKNQSDVMNNNNYGASDAVKRQLYYEVIKPSGSSGIQHTSILESNISVYPNPSNGLVNIGFKTDAQEDVTIGVYNLNGQLVKQITSGKTFDKGHNVQNCDISELSAGMYYFKIESNSFSVVKPLVKQ